MTLALEYRPRRFAEVAGQTPAAAVLYRMAAQRTVPSSLLFAGEHGCGKTSSARILGASLNCHEPPGSAQSWPCGRCPSCKAVAGGTSLDVIEVDAASNGTVDHIRDIREQALYATAGEHKVYIVDEAHGLTPASSNAMLKVMEETPPNTTFVFVTTEPRKILDTVASRCMTFTFPRIPAATIRGRLEYICADKRLSPEPALIAAIADRAAGAMRDAVMMLDQVTTVGITDLARWQALLGEPDFAPGLLAAAAQGSFPLMFEKLDAAVAANGDFGWIAGQLVSCMRDVLVLCAGGTIDRQGTALEQRAAIARHVPPARAVAAMRVLWDLQTRVPRRDLETGLKAACALVSDALRPAADAPQAEYRESEDALQALRSMAGDR